ncbi:MAG: hypothetical protein Fur0010_25860 [Bdellovibrio sp.]
MTSEAEISMIEGIQSYLQEKKFKNLTEVQKKSFVALLENKNSRIVAPTGSGKTLAYILPVVQYIKSVEWDQLPEGSPMAIVLAPTRELATQITKVFKEVTHHAKLRVRQLQGGGAKAPQNKRLKTESFDVLITNPGRLVEYLDRGDIKLDSLQFLVADEADQLIAPSFIKEFEKIGKKLAGLPVRIALFSATEPESLSEFITRVFPDKNFENLTIGGSNVLQKGIETVNIYVGGKQKLEITELFIKKEAEGSGIVFLNRKEDAESLFNKLKEIFPSKKFALLHGDMPQNERKKNFEKYRKTGGILVATDIAARGIDLTQLDWVLNYDLPFEAVYYVHRCGRVGRMGKEGRVYNLVSGKDGAIIARINKAIAAQKALKIKALEVPQIKAQQKAKAAKKKAPVSKVPVIKKTRPQIKPKRTPRYKRK